MTAWAKVHTDIIGDKKLLRAARRGAKHLHLLPWLIVFAKAANDDGRLSVGGLPADAEDLAEGIPGVTAAMMAACCHELAAAGVEVLTRDQDGAWRLAAWEKRQAKPSAHPSRILERVRRYRDKSRKSRKSLSDANVQGVTPVTPPCNAECNAQGNAIEGEGEGEGEREKNNYGAGTTPATPLATALAALPAAPLAESASKPPTALHLLAEDWQAIIGGVPSFDRIGRTRTAIRKAHPEVGDPQIREAWQRYLRAHVEAGRTIYANPQDFAARFRPWLEGNALAVATAKGPGNPVPRAVTRQQTEGAAKLAALLAAGGDA